MNKKLFALLLCTVVCLSVCVLMSVNASAEVIEWNENTTIPSSVTGSSDPTDPTIINVTGTISLDSTIYIYDNVKITGGGTLIKGSSGGLYVNTDAHLILEDITIDGQNIETSNEALRVYNSSLTIEEGTQIINVCIPYYSNGSVINSDNGTIVMNGGLIENNQVKRYGNIYLDGSNASSSTFVMNGGIIRNNKMDPEDQSTSSYGGGAFYVRYATLNINGGVITGNDIDDGYADGGGIYITSYGILNINGGYLSGNAAELGDGIFFSARHGASAQMHLSGDANILDEVYLHDSSYASKNVFVTSAVKNNINFTVAEFEEGRVLAQGMEGYILTESDLAKIGIAVYQDETPYYAMLDTENNQILMTAIDPGYARDYYISYFNNGGTGSTTDDTSYAEGFVATVMSPGCTRRGYGFIGWNTAADGTGTSYAVGDKITMTGDIQLYAQWQANSYTVIGQPTVGGTVTGSGAYVFDSTATLTAVADSGYKFVGWYDGDTLITESTAYSFTVEDTATYIARFELDITCTWVSDTDSGYVINEEAQSAIVRFLFDAVFNVDSLTITKAGIIMANGNDITADINSDVQVYAEGNLTTFLGDIIGITDSEDTYYAKAYVIADGEVYWSDIISCLADFTRLIQY